MLPPRIVPRRIARNVPASMSALPATSSSARRCCGSSAYLIGPKTVECVPRQKSEAKSSGTLPSHSPQAPERHDADLGDLHHARDQRLVDPIGERARRAGEEKERRDEQGAGEHHERGRAEARLLGQTERHDDAECALQQVVVERAQELRDEERREATSRQQLHEWRTHDNVLLIQTVVTAAHDAAMRRSHIEVSEDDSRP